MAKNKKGFLLYADQLELVESLKDSEAGRLLKHILRYVNDKNPIAPDRITAISFEPIKQQMNRDLINWETAIEKSRQSGSFGNLKRYNPDLYELVKSKKIKLDEAVNLAKSRTPIAPDRTRSHPIAKLAVNDNDNDNVNVNESIIDSHAKIFESENEKAWRERICMKHKIKIESLKNYFSDFFLHVQTQKKESQSLSERQQFFDNWLGKQNKEIKKSNQPQPYFPK